jgi:hypothetical protein
MGDKGLSPTHSTPVKATGHNRIAKNQSSRAADRFKSEIAKLPLRFAHAAGFKWATVAPEQDEWSRYSSMSGQTSIMLSVACHRLRGVR